MSRILIVSSANMDFVMPMQAVPAKGQTVIEQGAYRYVPGGKGANSAVAVSRLGGDCLFCAKLGRDANGDALAALYEREGIDCRALYRSDGEPTGLAAILVEADGGNRIVVYPGANNALTHEEIDRAFDFGVDALYMQMEIPTDAVLYAASCASAKHIPIFIDAGPADAAFPLQLLPRLTLFSPNESETEIFTGKLPDSEQDCLGCSQTLAARVDARYIVLKLGGRGSYVYDTQRASGYTVPSLKIKAVDTTAAGDAFTAALMLAYLECQNIDCAVRYATAVGALTVSRAGASSSIPTAQEIEEFIKDKEISLH